MIEQTYLLVHYFWYERSTPFFVSKNVEKLKEKALEWLNSKCEYEQDETNGSYHNFDGTEVWEEVTDNDYSIAGTRWVLINKRQTQEFYIMEIDVV